MRNHRLSSLVLSLLVAFGLWLFVGDNVSQEDDRTYNNVPVVMDGESVLKERNLMITNISANSVSLHLKGARSDLNRIGTSSANLAVRVDLSQITEPGRIRVRCTPVFPPEVSSGAVSVESQNPSELYLDVDYRRTKDLPVRINWTGTRSEDYIYDTESAMLDYPQINVSGPAAVVDQLDHAEIEVDLTDRSESISESFRYTLCDANNEPVDAGLVTTNVEKVRLEAPIQRIKEVQLRVDLVYGGGVTADNTTVTLSQDIIRVSGGEAVLAELGDSYLLGTINLADLDRYSNELTYSITLPEGVTNQTGVSEVTATVRFTGVVTKEFEIDNFQILNLPEGLSAEIINTSMKVKVRGPAAQVNQMTEEDIFAGVDLTNAEVGTATYKVNITFSSSYTDVGALKSHSVSAKIETAEG